MADELPALRQSLASRYRLDREIGRGGTSFVYAAWDLAHSRDVAIKVLRPEIPEVIGADRFRREIRIASGLSHPGIMPLLDSGEVAGRFYYVMPLIQGESLRDRLQREKQLPVEEAIRITQDVAAALEHAHTQGVVHRDVKPPNILFDGNRTIVADFGLARALSTSVFAGDGSLSTSGLVLGTVLYMAPEQAGGQEVDARADVYGLGCVLYEMLVGEPPFPGTDMNAVLARHMSQPAASVRIVRRGVPPHIDAAILRALEKSPADRFASVSDFSSALSDARRPVGLASTHPVRVGTLFVLGSLVALSAIWWLVRRLGLPDWVFVASIALLIAGLPIMLSASRYERKGALARTRGAALPVPSGPLGRLITLRGAIQGGALAFAGLIVGASSFMGLRAAGVGPFATLVSAGILSSRDRLVLADFENRTSDSTLGQTVTEALRIDLMRSAVVRLIETGDVTTALERMQRRAGTPLTASLAQEVAVREGATATIAGDVASLGGGFVLSARVVSAADGQTLLAERESAARPSELIAAVDRLSRKVREGIGESLRSIRAGVPLAVVTTPSLEALRKYSQAERLADAGRMEDANVLLDEAIRLDSSFAMAWRKKGVVLFNIDRDPVGEVAAVQRAYDLKERLPERERLLATARYHVSVDRDRAAQILAHQELLARWPDDVTTLNNISIALTEIGRFREAEQAARHGLEISPSTGSLWHNLIEVLALQGNLSGADSALRQWAIVSPESANRNLVAARLGWAKGDYAFVAAQADTASRSDQLRVQALGHANASMVALVQGRVEESRRHLRESEEIDERRGATRYRSMTIRARTETAVGKGPEAAVRYLDSVLARYPLDSLPAAGRPYPWLAGEYARARAAARAEALMREYEREVPAVLRNTPERYVAEGLIAQARGQHTIAINLLRKSRELEGCLTCRLEEIARSFEGLNQPDSALATYEAIVTTVEPGPLGHSFSLPVGYRRLGQLYEGKGDVRKAVEYYSRFVELWKGADPSLQPRVAEVRKRIAELSARER